MKATLLFDSNGTPTQDLRDLLSLMEVEHDGSLAGIRSATQAEWYQAGRLRAEIAEKHGHKKDEAMPLLRNLGFFNEIRAQRMTHFHCAFLGATVTAVRKRLAFLHSEWNRGIRFTDLVFFGSNRPLMKDKESPEVLLNAENSDLPFSSDWKLEDDLPQTEIEMMRMVYRQAGWLNEDKVVFIEATGKDGRNANTRDTLELWGNGIRGDVLVVSSQPFVSFQGIIAEKVLPSHANPECIGYAANTTLPVTTFLDNVAKLVYELADSEGL